MAATHAGLYAGNSGLATGFNICSLRSAVSGRNLWSVAFKRGISSRCSIRGRCSSVCRSAMGAKEAFQESVPDSHVWPEEKRPSVAHDVFEIDLPVVDLGPVFKLEELVAKGGAAEQDLEALQAQKKAILQQVKLGCEEYGFFQVVNHGVSAQVVDELTRACHAFFEQPSEVKEGAAGSEPGSMLGYTSMKKNIPHYPAFRWHEGAGLPPHWQREQLDGVAERLSNGGFGGLSAEEISTLFADYGSQAEGLALKVMELLAESLGLVKDYFAREFTSRNDSWTQYPRYFTRLNYYPRCPSPGLTLGVPGHTDPDILTVLHQDTVGGLQILSKDGLKWLGVKPVAGAFVINAGDVLQVWTNQRYLSAEHRVVTNDKSARLSIAIFFNPHEETDIIIPRELVDSEHPLQFRPFKAHEYYKLIAPLGIKGRQHLIRHFKLEDVVADSS